jgi:hypothetical protein
MARAPRSHKSSMALVAVGRRRSRISLVRSDRGPLLTSDSRAGTLHRARSDSKFRLTDAIREVSPCRVNRKTPSLSPASVPLTAQRLGVRCRRGEWWLPV